MGLGGEIAQNGVLSQSRVLQLYPKNLKNRLLGLAKVPIIDDRKRMRIALIHTRLRSLRSSILGNFRSSRKTDFSSSLGIAL